MVRSGARPILPRARRSAGLRSIGLYARTPVRGKIVFSQAGTAAYQNGASGCPKALLPARSARRSPSTATAQEHAGHGHPGHERWLSIAEAILLSIVALLAAWSGYSAAKWDSELSLSLAEASAARAQATRDDIEASRSGRWTR